MSDDTITPAPESELLRSPKRKRKIKTLLHSSGRPLRMLLESEILAAQSVSRTEKEVARRLGVSHVTYMKYAKMYGVYGRVMNRAGKGVNKPIRNENSGRYPLDRILNGEFPDYPIARLRIRLIRSGEIEPRCCKCGFSEKREADGKYPLILGFKDGDSRNKKRENLQLYCYNCFFLTVNNPHGKKSSFSLHIGVPNKDLPHE